MFFLDIGTRDLNSDIYYFTSSERADKLYQGTTVVKIYL